MIRRRRILNLNSKIQNPKFMRNKYERKHDFQQTRVNARGKEDSFIRFVAWRETIRQKITRVRF